MRRTLVAFSVLGIMFAGLTALQLTKAPSAEALQYACDSGVLSAFPSGDVARWKICPERDSGTLKWRAHAAVWCDNSAGAAVDCDLIEGTDVNSELLKNGAQVQFRYDWQDAPGVHIKNFNHTYACEGTALGQYQAIFYNLRVISRFSEVGSPKTRFSGVTNYMGSCAN